MQAACQTLFIPLFRIVISNGLSLCQKNEREKWGFLEKISGKRTGKRQELPLYSARDLSSLSTSSRAASGEPGTGVFFAVGKASQTIHASASRLNASETSAPAWRLKKIIGESGESGECLLRSLAKAPASGERPLGALTEMLPDGAGARLLGSSGGGALFRKGALFATGVKAPVTASYIKKLPQPLQQNLPLTAPAKFNGRPQKGHAFIAATTTKPDKKPSFQSRASKDSLTE